MLTFDKLTKEQQENAIQKQIGGLLEDILSGCLRFNDAENGDTFQAAIDKACDQAEKMRTPWFAGEYIMDAVYTSEDGRKTKVADTLQSFAISTAENAVYLERGEIGVYLSSL